MLSRRNFLTGSAVALVERRRGERPGLGRRHSRGADHHASPAMRPPPLLPQAKAISRSSR